MSADKRREIAEQFTNPEHLGISKLRQFNATTLRNSKRIVILCDGAKPLSALIPYDLFMAAQELRLVLARAAEERKG